jgi:hypothetical protein
MSPTNNKETMAKARLISPSGLLVVDASILKQCVMNADDPLTREHVMAGEYICYYCAAKVHPVAIGETNPQKNLPYRRPPHFSLFDGELHNESECLYFKRTNFSQTDPESEGSGHSPCMRYPNRLSLDWLNPLDQINPGIGNGTDDPDFESTDPEGSPSYSNWTAQNISSLVNHFLQTENRNSRLYVPGIEVTTYDKVFEKFCFLEEFDQNKLRIYFSQIIYTKTSRTTNKIFTFLLTDGTYANESRIPTVKTKLVINASEWMPQDIKNLKEKIDSIKNLADELRGQDELQKGKSLPWIFFLGYAKPENDSYPKLLCDDLRLIELCITDKLNNIPDIPHDRNDSERDEPSVDETGENPNPEFLEDAIQVSQDHESSELSSDKQEFTDIEELMPSEPEPQDLEPSANTLEPNYSDHQEYLHRNLSYGGRNVTGAASTKARQKRSLRRKAYMTVTKAFRSGFRGVKNLIKSLIRFLRGR